MPPQGRLAPLTRILRLSAMLSLICALVAVAAIVNGDSGARSQALVAVAIMLGAGSLLGMALLAWPYVRRKKDKNDPQT